MNLPPGKGLRLDLIGAAEGVAVVVSGVVRAGAAEKSRELSRTVADDAMSAMRVARDWLTARIVAEAEAHAPSTPPTLEEIEQAEVVAPADADEVF